MTLQNLPLEILCMIIRFIGKDQLRKQGASCLTVCKLWYQIAKPILLEDLRFSVLRFVLAPNHVYPNLRTFLRRLTIDVYGPEDWSTKEEDIVKLNEILISLFERNDHLASFTLRVCKQFEISLVPRQHPLSTWNPIRFLNALGTSKLSHLVVDTYGSQLSRAIHICPQLALRIPSLRSLRIRMYRICPKILELPQGDSPSQIESIIINLSHQHVYRVSAMYSSHCTERRGGLGLYNDMIIKGTEIAKQTPSLKVLEVMCHMYPCWDMTTMNCITGIETIIAGARDWGNEGEKLHPPILHDY
ncbi:uncharacterized protein N7479_010661 [Penicillium vulpinum]|uniref:F-box domain-containing protein n=1 Tax=Penicillium vulpinum TaxID=29845 RepID=A0A1V6S8U1_9EURO|nr:uncharacterized protein N7479_010661 [Penicillium vulpinum]KAJ5952248.1 hypothetical protein N7479_010661 [Penicillium vulpinum]OQE10462.1 hypothetical protein PENVUL_c004G06524 [Penicillium vulpinum]